MQFEAGFVFVGATAETHDRAVSKNYLQTEDVIACDAIFQTARPTGVRRDVSADGTISTRSWIGRIKQALLFHAILELRRDHAWFHHCHKIGRVDLLDPGHASQRQCDTASRWHTPAHITITRAARRDRKTILRGKF